MRLQEYVNTIVHCGRCRQDSHWCVRVDRSVPEPLRCVPRGGGGRGGDNQITCQRCGCAQLTVTDLERRVADALRGSGVDRWIRAGAVTVDC